MTTSSGWPDFKRELAGLAPRVEQVAKRWPCEVFDTGIVSTYDTLPFLFWEAFPSVKIDEIVPLALFSRLFASATLLQDKLIDAPASRPASDQLRVMAMQAEAYRVLHELFTPGAAFWDRFQVYLAEHVSACIEEQRFVTRSRPLREYTEQKALDIAIGKNGLARTIIIGLAELARDDGPLAPLVEVMNAWSVAAQMIDDLQDWKQDLRAGLPSLLLSRVASELPRDMETDEAQRMIARLARDVYYEGHATYVLNIAMTSLDAAERSKATLPGLSFYRSNGALRQRCEALRDDIVRIVDANKSRISQKPRVALSIPRPVDGWTRLSWGALEFLVRQWELGFGEARDITRFPEQVGFGAGETCYFGDVFQRAIIADVLCDANTVLGGALAPMIEHEVGYLLSRRLSAGIGGWSYFPDLPELPPDIDDLAQIMQVLIRMNRRPDVVDGCERPLSVLLRDNMHPDGSFETWIVPAIHRTPLEERQAEYVRRSWGAGADCGAMPNLLYALEMYDADRFKEVIHKGTTFLASRQREDGLWHSGWYAENYYAIYACLRLLAVVDPESSTISRAVQYLRETQRADGGWSTVGGTESDALNTAFALLGLATVPGGGAGARDMASVAAALKFLDRTRQPNGAWPSCKFIYVSNDRYCYGSQTMTTAYVLKAALAWHALAIAADGSAPVQA
jgi:squalene-hopene/tetraprenyl-beta-curcumene cyclase